MLKKKKCILQFQNFYAIISIISLGIILNKIRTPYIKEIISSIVPLFFIPYFYKELKLRGVSLDKSIKIISISYSLLIILMLDINFLGYPILRFLPRYMNNFLYYFVFWVIFNIALYKANKESEIKTIFNILIAYFITLSIPILNKIIGG